MEIFDFKRFSEKLDIKPADLGNLKYLQPKQLLKTGDTVVMSDGNSRYVYLSKKSDDTYRYAKALKLVTLVSVFADGKTDGAFVRTNPSGGVSYRSLASFNETLRHIGSFFSVAEIYRDPSFAEPADPRYFIENHTDLSGYTRVWKRDTII